jgi:Zn-dependent protease
MSLPLIGWAKPVPVNPLHLKDPSRDHMYISFAGPAANLLAGFGALISLLLLKWFVPDAGGAILKWVGEIYRVERMMAVSGSASIITPLVGILFFMMIINFMLAIFNLLPVPPLDGHWILAGLLPPGAAESFLRFGRYGIFILYALMFMGIFRILLIPVGWLIQLLLIL